MNNDWIPYEHGQYRKRGEFMEIARGELGTRWFVPKGYLVDTSIPVYFYEGWSAHDGNKVAQFKYMENVSVLMKRGLI